MNARDLTMGDRLTLIARLAGTVLVAAYVAMVLAPDNLPLQDLPNHVARAVAISDLLFNDGAVFGWWFQFEWHPVPYLLGDLLLMALVESFGPSWGGKAFAVAALLAIPGAAFLCLRRAGLSDIGVMIGVMVSLWMSTNWFFVMGFVHFQFAVAISAITILMGGSYLRDGRVQEYFILAALMLIGYFVHFAAFILSVTGLGAVALLRIRGLSREVVRRLFWLGMPIAAVAIWHVCTTPILADAAGGNYAVLRKLQLRGVLHPFLRYDKWLDFVLFVCSAAAILAPLLFVRKSAWKRVMTDERVHAAGLLSVAFFGLYLIMPGRSLSVAHIDVRALPLMWLFGMIGVLVISEYGEPSIRRQAMLIAATVLLSVCNLTLLAYRWTDFSATYSDYRRVVAQIRPGSVVLPVLTRDKVGEISVYAHMQAFVMIDAQSITPYIFSAPEMAPHFPYFAARELLPAGTRGSQNWYRYDEALPDGADVARRYDSIIATKPFDLGRLGFPVRVVYENEAAILLVPQASTTQGQ